MLGPVQKIPYRGHVRTAVPQQEPVSVREVQDRLRLAADQDVPLVADAVETARLATVVERLGAKQPAPATWPSCKLPR